MMAKITLVELIKRVNEIPAFPKTVIKILDMLRKEDIDAINVQGQIMKDQGLTTKLLKMANSAFYRGNRAVETVSDATVLLGFDTVQVLVLAASVDKVINKELSGYAYEKDTLWRESLLSAYMSKFIAKKVGFSKLDSAYIAGLLKDVGKVVLDEFVHENCKELLEKLEDESISYVKAEELVNGFNHCQAGSKVIRKWNLSEELAESIEFHHDPLLATINPKLVAIIHVADEIIVNMELHDGIDTKSHDFCTQVMSDLNLSDHDMEAFLDEAKEIIEDGSLFL